MAAARRAIGWRVVTRRSIVADLKQSLTNERLPWNVAAKVLPAHRLPVNSDRFQDVPKRA
ncbi:MAG: hypothetical protein Devi2KO_34950 [Devosia indica]